VIPRDFDDEIAERSVLRRARELLGRLRDERDPPRIPYRLPDNRIVHVVTSEAPRDTITYRVDGLDVIARRVRDPNVMPSVARSAPMLTVMGECPEMRDE
jgi:hypothetical protein